MPASHARSSPRSLACSASRSPAGPERAHPVDQDERHPYLAQFQHELCIFVRRCAGARATRSRAPSSARPTIGFTNVTAGLDAGFSRPRASPAAPAPTPVRRTRSRRSPSYSYDRRTFRGHRHDHLRPRQARLPPRGGRARRRIASISPALDGPANLGHTCLKGRFAHQFSRSRERLTALIREGGRSASRAGRRRSTVSPASSRESRATTARRDRRSRLVARHERGLCWSAMARMMRATIGTNNIDNCSRVCHSPTSFALRRSLGLSGATGSFADIDARRRCDHHRRQPDRGSPRHRRAHQAGECCAPAPRDDRPAPHRARRLLACRPAPAGRHERRGDARAVPRGPPRWADRTGLHRCAPRAEALGELLDDYAPDAVEITGVPAADLEAAAHDHAEAGDASILGPPASPVAATVRGRGRPATSR